MVGKTLGHYEIKEAIGAGAMGEVYRAHDTTLKRDVAIKVLPAGVTRDPDRLARLEREAQLLASLNHPNIATIHSLEESNGTRFLVLELIEGKSLSEEIATGPMPLQRVLEVCGQIAKALEAAHSAGVVHRDLKPANVLVTAAGRVKVLDFGIAKNVLPEGEAAETSNATELTTAGALLGTVPYMSPEQVRGQAVDTRTDIWAFGCVVFELLTGREPFARETMADTLSAILEREPDWELIPKDTPESVRTLMRRSLEKDADRRLQDIADARIEIDQAAAARTERPASTRATKLALAVAAVAAVVLVLAVFNVGGLRDRLSIGGSAPAPVLVRSIAVLPLQNLSGNPEDDAFADGLTEEITTQLAKLPGLRVTARSAALRFRQRPVDFVEVGDALGVDAVLDGSVRRAGDRLRVSAQLVEVASSVNLWVDEFDREWTLDALIGVQEEIALQIAAALDIRLTPEQRELLTKTTTPHADAYELYLRSFSYLGSGGRDDHMVGIELLRGAVAADPDFADAHAQLAVAYALMVEWGYDIDPRWLELAETEARRALALSPNSPVAYEALLVQSYRRSDPREVRDLSKRLLAVDPDNLTGQFMLGYVYVRYGFLDEGERRFEAALRADPFFLPVRMNMGTIEDVRGDLAAAEQRMRELLVEYPGHPLLTCFLAYYLAKQGKIDEAIGWAEPLRPIHPLSEIILAFIYSLEGDFDGARAMETPEMLEFADTAPWPGYYLAQVYALQNRTEETVAILDDQLRYGFSYRILESLPAYAGVRDRPEFQRLIERARQDYCDFAADDENLRAAFARDCSSP